MPCSLCNSLCHSSRNCTADINHLWAPVKKLIQEEPFALRKQYELISIYTVSILKIVNRKLGFVIASRSTGKSELIYNIIIYFFQQRIPNNRVLNSANQASIIDVSELVEAFASLLMWQTTSEKKKRFRESAYSLIDMCYRNTFCPEYIQLLQNNVSENPNVRQHLLMVLSQQARDELRAIGTLRAIELGMVPERNPEKAHLKKLKIKVKIDKHLDFKECFMCYDLKPHAKLGCDHEYCADCLVGTAKVRTKTFISCAVCRTEIKEVNVLTSELKKDLISQLKKE
jgi:hypothetical protein